MAKIKRKRRANAPQEDDAINPKLIAGIVVFIVLIFLIVAIALAIHNRYVSYATVYGKLYVDIDGKRYYEDDEITLKTNSITTLKCGFAGTAPEGGDKYGLKITSSATDETQFSYTLNGAKRMFIDGEDYTQYFDITTTENGGYRIAHVKDTPATMLKKRYSDGLIVAPETDPETSYFTLTVYNVTTSQAIQFALYFEDIKITFDPDGGGIIL